MNKVGEPTGGIRYEIMYDDHGLPIANSYIKTTTTNSSCTVPNDWSIKFYGGYDDTERVVNTNDGILVRCNYCRRYRPYDEYECRGCGAPT